MDIDDLEIDPNSVQEALRTPAGPDAELIDVREDYELARGILPGALHMPLSHFQDFLPHFTPDRKYIIYCEHGVRSLDVAAWLQANKGIHAKSMAGGFAVWTGPVAKHDPSGDSKA